MSNWSLRSRKTDKSGEVKGGNGGNLKTVVTDELEKSAVPVCQVCEEQDADEMVSCDNCLKWHCFGCVGVTKEIENHPWSCTKCVSATGVQETSSTSYAADQSAEQKKQLSEVADTSIADPVLSVSTIEWVVTKENLSRKSSRTSSARSSRSSQALAKLKLQKLEELRAIELREAELQRELAAEAARKEKAYLEEKYQLLEEALSDHGSASSVLLRRMEEWINAVNNQQDLKQSTAVPISDSVLGLPHPAITPKLLQPIPEEVPQTGNPVPVHEDLVPSNSLLRPAPVPVPQNQPFQPAPVAVSLKLQPPRPIPVPTQPVSVHDSVPVAPNQEQPRPVPVPPRSNLLK